MIIFRFIPGLSKHLGVVYRPHGRAKLIHREGSNHVERAVEETFLIDSGADITVVPHRAGVDFRLPSVKKRGVAAARRDLRKYPRGLSSSGDGDRESQVLLQDRLGTDR